MVKKLCMLLLVLIFVCCVSGCISKINPETGQKTVSADSNSVVKIEVATEGAITILGILSAFFPVLIPVTAAAMAVYGTWRKVKPKLTKAQTDAELYHATTSAVVMAIENYKTANPTEWLKLEEKLLGVVGPNANNVIRAIRNLPPYN